MELVISVQTHLLDIDPALGIRSQLEVSEVLQCANTGPMRFELVAGPSPGSKGPYLSRLADGRTSYLQMVHPSDGCEMPDAGCEMRDAEHTVVLRHRLFPERLEKGVIRRGRLRGIFLSRHHDIEVAAACYDEFVDSSPPLTV